MIGDLERVYRTHDHRAILPYAEWVTSRQHQHWLDWGLPWHLARPLAALERCLRSYGYVTGDIGDPRHMDAEPPEDHTPYSETGWPIKTPYGWVTALDVMEPDPADGLPTLAELGRQLHADRLAGDPGVDWLKYLNWQPEGPDGPCFHDAWEPDYARHDSSDVGHLHASGRSDRINSAAGDDYDPVARLLAGRMTGDHDMIFQVTGVPKGATDVAGTTVPENGQCLATPSGPFNLSGAEFFSLPEAAQHVRIRMPWARLEVLCQALAAPTSAPPAK